MADQTMKPNPRLDSFVRKAPNTDEEELFLKRVNPSPLPSSSVSPLPTSPTLKAPSLPGVRPSPTPNGLSVNADSEPEELLRAEDTDATMAQITKDGLDRLFLELKSK